jgi:hypothetical protein
MMLPSRLAFVSVFDQQLVACWAPAAVLVWPMAVMVAMSLRDFSSS